MPDFTVLNLLFVDQDGKNVMRLGPDNYGSTNEGGPYYGVAQFRTNVQDRGDFWLHSGVSHFNGRPDPTQYWGYNQSYGGTPVLANEPGLSIGIEADYDDGEKRSCEAYLQFINGFGTPLQNGAPFLRPWYWQIERTTGKLLTAKILGNPLVFADDLGHDYCYLWPGQALFKAPPTGDNYMVLESNLGSASHIVLGGNGDNSAAQWTSYGNVSTITVGAAGSLRIYGNGAVAIGVDDSIGTLTVESKTNDSPAFVARAHSVHQSANLIEAHGTNGGTSWHVTNDGIPVAPTYFLRNLPSPGPALRGARIFIADARKSTEHTTYGTGILAYCDGRHWVRCSDDAIISDALNKDPVIGGG